MNYYFINQCWGHIYPLSHQSCIDSHLYWLCSTICHSATHRDGSKRVAEEGHLPIILRFSYQNHFESSPLEQFTPNDPVSCWPKSGAIPLQPLRWISMNAVNLIICRRPRTHNKLRQLYRIHSSGFENIPFFGQIHNIPWNYWNPLQVDAYGRTNPSGHELGLVSSVFSCTCLQ